MYITTGRIVTLAQRKVYSSVEISVHLPQGGVYTTTGKHGDCLNYREGNASLPYTSFVTWYLHATPAVICSFTLPSSFQFSCEFEYVFEGLELKNSQVELLQPSFDDKRRLAKLV